MCAGQTTHLRSGRQGAVLRLRVDARDVAEREDAAVLAHAQRRIRLGGAAAVQVERQLRPGHRSDV